MAAAPTLADINAAATSERVVRLQQLLDQHRALLVEVEADIAARLEPAEAQAREARDAIETERNRVRAELEVEQQRMYRLYGSSGMPDGRQPGEGAYTRRDSLRQELEDVRLALEDANTHLQRTMSAHTTARMRRDGLRTIARSLEGDISQDQARLAKQTDEAARRRSTLERIKARVLGTVAGA